MECNNSNRRQLFRYSTELLSLDLISYLKDFNFRKLDRDELIITIKSLKKKSIYSLKQ